MSPEQAVAIDALAIAAADQAPDPGPKVLAVVRGVFAAAQRERLDSLKAKS